MVPSSFVVLEQLPLTANGKLDVRALPAPEIIGEEAYRAPGTATEILLCRLYGELTGAERIGLDDGFFALGGHSLLAMRLIARVREETGLDLPLRALFEHPTVAGLSDVLTAAQQSRRPKILTGEGDLGAGARSLSYGQLRLWALDRIEGGSSSYNMPAALRLRGALDREVLSASFHDIVMRHEALRTLIIDEDGVAVGRLGRVPEAEALVGYEDLSDLGAAERERRVAEVIRAQWWPDQCHVINCL